MNCMGALWVEPWVIHWRKTPPVDRVSNGIDFIQQKDII